VTHLSVTRNDPPPADRLRSSGRSECQGRLTDNLSPSCSLRGFTLSPLPLRAFRVSVFFISRRRRNALERRLPWDFFRAPEATRRKCLDRPDGCPIRGVACSVPTIEIIITGNRSNSGTLIEISCYSICRLRHALSGKPLRRQLLASAATPQSAQQAAICGRSSRSPDCSSLRFCPRTPRRLSGRRPG